MRVFFALVACCAVGCDKPGTTATDLAFADDLVENPDLTPAFMPVSPPPLPIIPNQGGPIIASPEIVTLTWMSDPIAADLEAFDDWEVTSTFWKDLMGEWGVGPGTHLAHYRNPSPAPAVLDEAAVQTLINDAVGAGAIPSPAPSRIYTIYPPSGTTVTQSGLYSGCIDFQAYHSSFDFSGTLAIYAVAPRCSATQGFSATDYTTWGMSHEVMEASSDPNFRNPAWLINKQSLATPELGENADLCAGHPTKIEGHEVTRNYSNVAARAGDRPCVPAPAGPMFGVFPDPAEVTIAPGGSATVTLRLYSTAPMPAFNLRAVARSNQLVVSLSKKSGTNGDTVTLMLLAGGNWIETPGANLVDLYAFTSDYTTRRDLIVHAP
jgi:hypothetical protein